MGSVIYWLRAYRCDSVSAKEVSIDLLKHVWLGMLLFALGAAAFITAVILAYPVLAHMAAKL